MTAPYKVYQGPSKGLFITQKFSSPVKQYHKYYYVIYTNRILGPHISPLFYFSKAVFIILK